MLYAILIHQPNAVADHLSEADEARMLAEHRALQERTKADGAFVAATQLMEGYTASTVRVQRGKVSIADGPFAETKELFIGLYLFECKNLDEAIEYASAIPHAEYGTVEIRPVAYHEDRAGAVND